MPLESLAQAMNRISAEVRGGPLSRMARGGPVRMADGGAVYDPMGNVAVPPSEGFAPSPAYENIADAVARAGSAVGSPVVGGLQTAGRVYAEKSREAAAENEALRQQAVRNMQGELGYAGMPLGAGQMLLSQLGTATLPLTAAAKTAGYAATQATGNPRFGENVEFMSGLVDPSHVGMLKAAAPMMAVKAARELSPIGLYSHGAEAAAGMPQAKGSTEQMLAYLQNKGSVKPAELESARAAFAERPTVTREELAQHFRQQMPVVEEKILGAREPTEEAIRQFHDISPEVWADMPSRQYTKLREEFMQSEGAKEPVKFSEYTLPGGENYRELLLKTPTNYDDVKAAVDRAYAEKLAAMKAYNDAPPEIAKEVYKKAAEASKKYDEARNDLRDARQNTFKSSHWDEPNVLAHIRMSDRTGPNGEKVLHVEELQSDWAQQGRKEGFSDPKAVANWQKEYDRLQDEWKASTKKMDDISDRVAPPVDLKFEPGKMSPREYERQLDVLARKRQITLGGDKEFIETLYERQRIADDLRKLGRRPNVTGPAAGPYVTSTEGWTDLALKRVLKEAAEGGYDKVVWTPGAGQAKRYPGGGAEREKGMKGYYDNIVPKRLQDIARRHDKGAKVGMVEGVLPDDIAAPGIDITPAMRESILRGQPHMAEGGAVYDPMGNVSMPPEEGIPSPAYENIADATARAGAAVGRPIVNVLRGAAEIPGTVGYYFAEKSAQPDPSQRIAEDIRSFGGKMIEGAKQDPVGFALDVAPVVGEIRSGMEAGELITKAEEAEAVGDFDKAKTFRQLAAVAAAGAAPLAGTAARLAKRGAKVGAEAVEAGAKVGTDVAEVVSKEAASALDDLDHPAMIDTRYPTGKKRIDEVEGERRIADLKAMQATPELYETNVNLVKDYVNMPDSLKVGSTDEVAENFINHVKDNLLYLHDQVPENIRERSQLWYDGARKIAEDWSEKYGISDSAAAGALAALSPQKDWYQNVSLAQRVVEALKGGGENFYNGFMFSPEMQRTYEAIGSLNKPEYAPMFEQISGRSIGDIDKLKVPDDEKAILKAMWIRLYDEAHNSKSYPIVTPEGGFGDMVKTSKDVDARVAWGSMNEIGKAIRAIEGNGDPALLNEIMGGKHKVRNFYNNILAPNSKRGDVTIDTHAVAAGLLRPLSQKSVEVAHNFKTSAPKGMPGASGSAASGVQGTYPLYAEAYRRAAEERGILPRQMQSITWEAVRGLFPETFKTSKNIESVDALWNKYRAGEASLDETRQAISNFAGGVRPPTWFRPDGAPDEALRSAGNAGELSGSSVSRKASGGIVGGAGSGASGAPSKEILRLAAEHGLHRPQVAHALRQNNPSLTPEAATSMAKSILSGERSGLQEILSDKLMKDLRRALRDHHVRGRS